MSKAETQVRPKTIDELSMDMSIFRMATGEQLAEMSKILASSKIADQTKIYQPVSSDIEEEDALRFEITNPRSLRSTPEFVTHLNYMGKKVSPRLLKEVPSLKDPIDDLVLSSVHMVKNHKGEYPLYLRFDQASSKDLIEEQRDTRKALGGIACTTAINWPEFAPALKLAYFKPRSITEDQASLIKTSIESVLPMPVSLLEATLPRYSEVIPPPYEDDEL